MKNRISKWGNSLAIRIPKDIAQETGLAAGDEVQVVANNNDIVISPQDKKYTLDELLEGMNEANLHTEIDWGNPQGNEIW